MRIIPLYIMLLVFLSSCAQLGEDRKEVAQFAVADLEVALSDAIDHQDIAAARCWYYLLVAAKRWQESPVAIGAASAFQRLRDYRRFFEGEELRFNCAILIPSNQVLRVLKSAVGIP
jgi:hypothetical protein